MGIFTDILGKILGGAHPAATPAATPGATPAPAATAASPAPQTTAATAPSEPVDVEAVLNGLNEQHGNSMHWQTSIVDMLKLLDMDSSLATREKLADELHYTGDKTDTATMNEWLHAEVMKQLAANGGKLPASLQA
jgi:hypothetical protein